MVLSPGPLIGWDWGEGFVAGLGTGLARDYTKDVGMGDQDYVGEGAVMPLGVGGGDYPDETQMRASSLPREATSTKVLKLGEGPAVQVVLTAGLTMPQLAAMAEAPPGTTTDTPTAEAKDTTDADTTTYGGGLPGLPHAALMPPMGPIAKSALYKGDEKTGAPPGSLGSFRPLKRYGCQCPPQAPSSALFCRPS